MGVAPAAGMPPSIPGAPRRRVPLRRRTPVPCPLGGKTTSREATVRLHLGRALAANAGGPAAAPIALRRRRLRPTRIPVPAPTVAFAAPALRLAELQRSSRS